MHSRSENEKGFADGARLSAVILLGILAHLRRIHRVPVILAAGVDPLRVFALSSTVPHKIEDATRIKEVFTQLMPYKICLN